MLGAQGEMKCGVGLLIDEDSLRLTFSPLACDGLSLPVVVFTPLLKWREGTTINRGACVFLCMLQKFELASIDCTPDNIEKCFSGISKRFVATLKMRYVGVYLRLF